MTAVRERESGAHGVIESASVYVCVCGCVYVCGCVCVCGCERERELKKLNLLK